MSDQTSTPDATEQQDSAAQPVADGSHAEDGTRAEGGVGAEGAVASAPADAQVTSEGEPEEQQSDEAGLPPSAPGDDEPVRPESLAAEMAQEPAADMVTAAPDAPEPESAHTVAPVDPAPTAQDAGPAVPAPKPTPRPKPAIPSPAALRGKVHAPAAPAAAPAAPSASAAYGRVDEQGRVFVREGDGEREVGTYAAGTPEEGLQYYARKYDEIFASATLLRQRMETPEVAAKEIADGLATLKEQTTEPKAVGDLAALAEQVRLIEEGLATKRETEQAERAKAKEAARVRREEIVAQAEQIAAQPSEKVQWKQSGARMRELLEEWKTQQRTGARLDKPTENALWQRFSAARNSFDKARRVFFARLDEEHAEAKAAKEDLVAQAEQLQSSTDWGPTAGAFKRLMDQWRRAGRASRADDDALWARFKAAQDAFFHAKDEVAAAEDESFRGNLAVKEELLKEAEAILPVSDIEQAKARLRTIQDKWEKAGKVPRADIDRTEKALRRVENAVREAEDKKWQRTNPELSARANSLVTQLEARIAKLEKQIGEADDKRRPKLESELESTKGLLEMAQRGMQEFGG